MDVPQGWRYKKDGQDHGPVGYTALQKMARSGKLADDDLVYSPTVGRWVNAWEVTGLFDLEAAAGAAGSAGLEDQALARRRRILLTVVAVDIAVTAIAALALLLALR
jgi:hypothetical protein